MRAPGVLVDAPAGDLLAGVAQRSKSTRVQAFVPEFAVEALEEGVQDGLAGFDDPQTNAGPFGPVEHGAACAFRAVVEDDLPRRTVHQRQIVKIARQSCTGDRHLVTSIALALL